MAFLDKFRKKDEKPVKKEEPKEEKIVLKDDPRWATTEDKPVEDITPAKEAPKKKAEVAEDKGEKKMAEKKTATKKTAEKKPAAAKSDKVWHITKRDEDGKWQIKAEGAAKATKLFNTKAEAEDYVKTLKSNNEGSRVVKHKKTGEFQKK